MAVCAPPSSGRVCGEYRITENVNMKHNIYEATRPMTRTGKKLPANQAKYFAGRTHFADYPVAYFRTLAGGLLYELVKSTNLDLTTFGASMMKSSSNLSTIIHGRRDPSLGTLLHIIDCAGFELHTQIVVKEDPEQAEFLRKIAEIDWP